MPDAPQSKVCIDFYNSSRRRDDQIRETQSKMENSQQRPMKLSLARTVSWTAQVDPEQRSPTTDSLNEFIAENYEKGTIWGKRHLERAKSYKELSGMKHPNHKAIEELKKQAEQQNRKMAAMAAEKKKE